VARVVVGLIEVNQVDRAAIFHSLGGVAHRVSSRVIN
jgi:hypothetical protein